jgi:plasmid replication initiation protein
MSEINRIDQSHYPVIKKNIINSAKFDISLSEYRIILAALSKITKFDTDFYIIEFTINEFNNIFYNKDKISGSLYDSVRKACKSLVSRTIILENENNLKAFQWVSLIEYDKNTSMIKIRFHEELKDFVLFYAINKEYTKYMLSNIARMNSVYTVRLYEILKQYEKIGKIEFKIDKLKNILGINANKYPIYANLKNRILDIAQEEMIKKSDIYFVFHEVKYGRKITGVNFTIIQNKESTKFHTEFLAYNKFKIIEILNNLLAKYLSIRLYSDILEKIHRLVLIDLIIFMREGRNWGTVLHPVPFIESKIKEFTEKYDLENIKDY